MFIQTILILPIHTQIITNQNKKELKNSQDFYITRFNIRVNYFAFYHEYNLSLIITEFENI